MLKRIALQAAIALFTAALCVGLAWALGVTTWPALLATAVWGGVLMFLALRGVGL